ncbi:MAG: hypothetical protein WA160_10060 [Pseudobdellovibrio sp.]
MKYAILKIILVLIIASGCAKNIFQSASSSSSDDSLLIDAKLAINSFDYSSAITIVTTKMSASGQAQVAAKDVLASAYAGKCGLNFVSYLNSLATASSTQAFALMMTPFVGIVADPAACLLALKTLDTVGTSAQRSANENAFAAVVGMSLLGSQIRVSADIAPVNGDGIADANICNMSNAEMDNVILGFGYMVENFAFLSVKQLGAGSQTAINNLVGVCAAVSGGVPCTITNPASISQPLRDVMKRLINTDDYGVGAVHTGGNAILIGLACP